MNPRTVDALVEAGAVLLVALAGVVALVVELW